MIEIVRGDEPPALAALRAGKLVEIGSLLAAGWALSSYEFKGYDIVKRALWEAQRRKCCYCERVIECAYYDVEHYRPKAEANLGPHHGLGGGYWWLAFTWENLLFSCKNCNEGKAKGIQFPLTAESVPLTGGQQPPRGERPLLIDPARECGIDHILFREWPDKKWRPSGRTEKGRETIRVCRLDRDDIVELYTDHVKRTIGPHVDEVQRALRQGDAAVLREQVRKVNVMLLRRCRPYVGLSYDALQHFVPDTDLAAFGQAWRRPP